MSRFILISTMNAVLSFGAMAQVGGGMSFNPSTFFGVGIGEKVYDIVDVDDLHATQTDSGISYDVEGLKLLNAHSFWGFRIDSLQVNLKTDRIHSIYASTIIYERENDARHAAREAWLAIERISGVKGKQRSDGASSSENGESIVSFAFPRYGKHFVSGEIKMYSAAAGYFAIFRVSSLTMAFEGHSSFSSMSGNYSGVGHKKQMIAGAFAAVKDKVVVISSAKGSGSGFVAQDQGKKYMYTNRHVVSGSRTISVKFLDGTRLVLGDVEVAKGLDLVRFEISTAYPALEFDDSIPNIGDRIVTFGNSSGTGVCTEIQGLINGVGPTAIETDAEFVKGNSGSPILGANYKVMAIATFVVDGKKMINWTNEGTRFSRTRRFGLRVSGAEWIKMRWSDFVKETEDE